MSVFVFPTKSVRLDSLSASFLEFLNADNILETMSVQVPILIETAKLYPDLLEFDVELTAVTESVCFTPTNFDINCMTVEEENALEETIPSLQEHVKQMALAFKGYCYPPIFATWYLDHNVDHYINTKYTFVDPVIQSDYSTLYTSMLRNCVRLRNVQLNPEEPSMFSDFFDIFVRTQTYLTHIKSMVSICDHTKEELA